MKNENAILYFIKSNVQTYSEYIKLAGTVKTWCFIPLCRATLGPAAFLTRTLKLCHFLTFNLKQPDNLCYVREVHVYCQTWKNRLFKSPQRCVCQWNTSNQMKCLSLLTSRSSPHHSADGVTCLSPQNQMDPCRTTSSPCGSTDLTKYPELV